MELYPFIWAQVTLSSMSNINKRLCKIRKSSAIYSYVVFVNKVDNDVWHLVLTCRAGFYEFLLTVYGDIWYTFYLTSNMHNVWVCLLHIWYYYVLFLLVTVKAVVIWLYPVSEILKSPSKYFCFFMFTL